MLVDEGDGSELEQAFASVCHGLDVPLVADRRCHDTELSGGGIDHYLRAVHACRVDPGDERACLCSAHADGLRLGTGALVADEDVVVATCQGGPGLVPDADVLVADAVQEGVAADGGIAEPGEVALERRAAAGRVLVSGGVAG